MERSVSIEKRVLSKSVLLISYYFPPMPGAGALRPGRLAKFLPVFGWTPTTLTGPWHAGEEFGDVIPVMPLGDPLAARVRGLWRIVTSSARWSPVALRSALTLTARQRFDAIVSVFSPAYSHVLAAIVARRLGIPWLADYSEAWTGNKFRPESPGTSRSNRLIEIRCLQGAAAITCATPGIKSLLSKLHGRPDIEVIENAVDAAEWERIPSLPPQTFTILYVGQLYGGLLNLELLFAAVTKLRRAGHPAGAAARFEFYCDEHSIISKAGRRWQLEDVITLHQVTIRERVLHAERRAAVLLMLFPMRHISVIPSKLYEYYGARRPILAIGPAQSRSNLGDLIEGNRLGYFATTEGECGASICALYERFRNGRYETDPSPSWSPPTALTTTCRFAAVLDRIVRLAPTSDVGPVATSSPRATSVVRSSPN